MKNPRRTTGKSRSDVMLDDFNLRWRYMACALARSEHLGIAHVMALQTTAIQMLTEATT